MCLLVGGEGLGVHHPDDSIPGLENGWQFNWRLSAGFVLQAGEILQ